jgi:hypothetical protein
MVKIVGFNLTKISIEREKEMKGKLEIKSNLSVTDVNKENIDLSKENEVVAFDFNLTINYEPKVAEIVFNGEVLVLMSHEEAKNVFKKWKKKEIEDSIRIIIFNTILVKCNIKALELEDELNLPTHIPMPKLAPQQQKSYTG